jgi:sugar lactone lactonase YvrE
MKAEPLFLSRAISHLFGGALCAGTVLLMAASAQAQNLFATDFEGGKIYEITSEGVQTTFATGLVNPAGLAFNSAGDLFVADNGSGNIYEFTSDGTRTTFAAGLDHPYGLAFDSGGDLFVGNQGTSLGTGTIYAFTPSGAQSTFAHGLNYPYGLAFNSAGDLFEADALANDIHEFTPGGVLSAFAYALNTPGGLAFNGAGDLFEADHGSGNIYEFTPAGTQSTFAFGLNYCGAVDFNSAGDLFVANQAGITKITPDETQSIFTASVLPAGLAFQPSPELVATVTNDAIQVAVTMPSPYYSTIVQVSTDMVNWTSVCTNTPPYTYTDSMGTTLPCRFYRALLGP